VTELIVFHHAQGLTDGVRAFADELRGDGHSVHVPDLYEGRTFDALADGLGYLEQVGFPTIIERGQRAAAELPRGVAYLGFSLGAMPAQLLAQTRSGALGAVLLHGCVPPAELGSEWPRGIPLQLHMMEGDEQLLPPYEDLAAARALDATLEGAELFLYPGDRHLFTDRSLPDYDARAAGLVTERVRAFLGGLG
jgi:dienelactone hydrolase